MRPIIFSFCAQPSLLHGLVWLSCYLGTGKHISFYVSFVTVPVLLAVTAPAALLLGFSAAAADQSGVAPCRWLSKGYISIVRGVPDIAFFLFFIIALDQGIEYLRSLVMCPNWDQPLYQGNDFVVCPAAKMPLADASPTTYIVYAFLLAVISFTFVFGAFAGNVLSGAMKAVPRAQVETAEAYGFSGQQTFWRIIVPQMWIYALPGLSNLWMALVKSTPLLSLLGIKDIVFWARELGGSKAQSFTDYPHPDWRMWYFLVLLIFYLVVTKLSEMAFERLSQRLAFGQATIAGESQRGRE